VISKKLLISNGRNRTVPNILLPSSLNFVGSGCLLIVYGVVSDVYRICTLKADLSGIDSSKFNHITSDDGNSYYCIEYDLRMTLEDEMLRFELIFEKKSYGHVTAEFD
jgi:hypothetical protein